jgi:flavin reductase (DIM6/NTAB) family NADH-FMN oxidoreductase RutF
MTMTEHQQALFAALGRVPSGLFIVTAGCDGDATGMLASWVQQCSFEPPQISLAVRRGRGLNERLQPGVAFTVNILADDQPHLIAHFGRGFDRGEPAFNDVEIEQPPDAPPILKEALAYLQCAARSRCSAGDHDLIVGEVIGGGVLNDGAPMVHLRKSGSHY